MKQMKYIGKDIERPDAVAKATGKAVYLDDVSLPGMLHCAILRPEYAHARIVSIDTVEAEKMEGVIKVVTGRDAPGLTYGDNIRDQIAGSIVFGMGGALTERITIRQGLVQESNFHDYLVPKMGDAPEIEVEILAGGTEPTGVGQTGAVLVAPAIAGAFYRLTGKRLRHMPFTRERVKAILA